MIIVYYIYCNKSIIKKIITNSISIFKKIVLKIFLFDRYFTESFDYQIYIYIHILKDLKMYTSLRNVKKKK
jgi:hypothetical protein